MITFSLSFGQALFLPFHEEHLVASLGTPVFPGTQGEKPCRMKRGIYELNRNEVGEVTSFG